jgi:hypothetical protein
MSSIRRRLLRPLLGVVSKIIRRLSLVFVIPIIALLELTEASAAVVVADREEEAASVISKSKGFEPTLINGIPLSKAEFSRLFQSNIYSSPALIDIRREGLPGYSIYLDRLEGFYLEGVRYRA